MDERIRLILDGSDRGASRAFRAVSSDLRAMDRVLGQVSERAIRTGRALRNVGAGMTAGISAPMIALGVRSISLLATQERAMAEVEQAVISTGGAAGYTADELFRVASGLQNMSTYGDEDILNKVTGTLLTFVRVVGPEFERAQGLVLDMATALETDLQSAAILVGKALDDPIRGITALGRSGVQFSDEQKAVIEALVETGRVADAQNLIMNELARQFGGQAAAAAATLGGEVQQLGNAFGDLLERVGSGFAPFVSGATGVLMGLTEAMSGMSAETLSLVTVLGGLAVGIGPVLAGLGFMAIGVGALIPVLTGAASALTAVGVAAFAALGPIGLVMGVVAGGAALWYAFSDGAEEAEDTQYDAAEASRALNLALGQFHRTAAPDAGQAAMALAENNISLAESALQAAEGTYAQIEAMLELERLELSALNAQNQPGAFGPLLSDESTITSSISAGEEALRQQSSTVEAAVRDLEEKRRALVRVQREISAVRANGGPIMDFGNLRALVGLSGDDLLPDKPEERRERTGPDAAEESARSLAQVMEQLTYQSQDAQNAMARIGLSPDAIEKAQRFDAAVRILTGAGVDLGAQWEDTGHTIAEQIQLMIDGTVDADVEFERMTDRIEAIRSIGERAMSGLTDAIVGSARTGELAIEDMVIGALEDLAKLGIQQNITDPLGDALFGSKGYFSDFLSGMFGGGGTGAKTVKSANGNVFAGGDVVAFATGGVVSGPTTFPMVGGNTGLMGEAGPEAIMPLTRLGNGKLGVQATGGGQGGNVTVEMPFTLQVIGGASEERMEMAPDGKSAQLFITGVVKEAFRAGTFRKELAQYGARKQPVGGA